VVRRPPIRDVTPFPIGLRVTPSPGQIRACDASALASHVRVLEEETGLRRGVSDPGRCGPASTTSFAAIQRMVGGQFPPLHHLHLQTGSPFGGQPR
jgi:hypothetical protein